MAHLTPLRILARRGVGVGEGDDIAHIRGGCIVESDCGSFLQVLGLDGVAEFGVGFGPGDGEGKAGEEVVDY